jgi:exoribonuclease-2
MRERGFLPEFGADVEREVASLREPADGGLRDLTSLLWFSIDNDDSRDLDQISWAEEAKEKGGATRLLVGIADVDALVGKGSATDDHARQNTTSVYTGVTTFPMLPPRLSFDLTSLNEDAQRHAIVVEMTVGPDGVVAGSDLYLARVRNRAKLAYNAVAAWLEGDAPPPPKVAATPGLPEQIRLQDAVAQRLRAVRHAHGALELASQETRPVFDDGKLVDLAAQTQNRAQELIEDLMVAANGVTARFLAARKVPSLRRVVRTPARWERIVELAASHGEKLPDVPDAPALSTFLLKMRDRDPFRFPDLSLSVVKLMGPGEYVVERPGEAPVGHFGLAVRDYTHSTAPNRRFPDLITHRLLKAALAGTASPYAGGELDELARHCTEKENDAQKVERQVRKSAAALLLEPRVGETFDGIVTGASEKGTWVRIFKPPVEGRVVQGFEGMDVGQRVRVKLVATDVERGYIDFVGKRRQ